MNCKICCKECSRIYESQSALMGAAVFEEENNWHTHNQFLANTVWECADGHQFRTQAYQPCWCGWSADKEKDD